MEIPLLPVALGGIGLTFALAVLGWWVASRVERRRRTLRRARESQRLGEHRDGPPRRTDGG